MESTNQLEQRPGEAFPERPVCRHGDRFWPDRAVRLERVPCHHSAEQFCWQCVRPVWQLQQQKRR